MRQEYKDKIAKYKAELRDIIHQLMLDKNSSKEYISYVTPYERYYAVYLEGGYNPHFLGNRKITDSEVDIAVENTGLDMLVEVINQLDNGL